MIGQTGPISASEADKSDAAQSMAHAHFLIDPAIEKIVRLIDPTKEDTPLEPIKLLEVNTETIKAGIQPIRFAADPANGVPFSVVVIEIRPEEYALIKSGGLNLPHGWRLAASYSRPESS